MRISCPPRSAFATVGLALLQKNIIYRNALSAKVSRVGNFEMHIFPFGERLFSADLNTYYLGEMNLPFR